MPKVVCAGHLCLDVIPTLFQPLTFEAGALIDVGAPTLSTGGSVSNTGLALHRLGVQVELVGRTGSDAFGEIVRQILTREGAKTALTASDASATSYTVVLNPPGQDRMFLHHPGANHEFGAADVPDEALASADLLHLGYPPLMRRLYQNEGVEVVDLFHRARNHGCLTSLDMALPDPDSEAGKVDWQAWLERVLPSCDLFLPSAAELRRMLAMPSASLPALADRALSLGANVIAIKDGSNGLFAAAKSTLNARLPESWAGVTVEQPCFSVPVVGTTGAGDATVAGFLLGLLRGEPLAASARLAVAVGAWCVTQADAVSGIPSWAELSAWLAEN